MIIYFLFLYFVNNLKNLNIDHICDNNTIQVPLISLKLGNITCNFNKKDVFYGNV